MIEIEPTMFERVITIGSLPKGGKALCDPLQLNFLEKHLHIGQMDIGEVIGVYAIFRKKTFTNYEPIGSIQVSALSLVKMLRNSFKTEKTVVFKVDEENIYIIGESEEYRELRPSMELNNITDERLKKTLYGYIPSKVDIKNVFKLDASMLEVKGEEVTFDYGKNTLNLVVETEVSTYKKKYKLESVKDITGHVTVFNDYLDRITSALSGSVYLIFTGDEEEEGPVVIAQKTDLFDVSYFLMPKATI